MDLVLPAKKKFFSVFQLMLKSVCHFGLPVTTGALNKTVDKILSEGIGKTRRVDMEQGLRGEVGDKWAVVLMGIGQDCSNQTIVG